MDLGDAYAHFNVSDRSVPLDPAVLDSLLGTYDIGTSERTRMEKAHALIQRDQAERFGNQPAAATMPVVRRNNYPLDSWPVGLRNIGNTCYLNSVLQFLFTIKPLRDLILNCEKISRDELERVLACANCRFNSGRLVACVGTDKLYRCQGKGTRDTQHKPRRGSPVRTPRSLNKSLISANIA